MIRNVKENSKFSVGIIVFISFCIKTIEFLFCKKILEKCEKQESNLRTPARTDLESASVDHLDILARNNICFRIVKGFEF